ncbi:MAG TPA: MFS transporter [Acidocella sp.]|jgi:MFS family permease|nr:MFS transporter [Acidocella sp.]
MRPRIKATNVVLALLCAMYFITYIDRVNVGTAASGIQHDLHLSNTELGLVFSAFAYPYLLFQIGGGWIADRFGPRSTLFLGGLIWAAATIATGLVGGLTSLFVARLLLGFGEGATFPTATRAMQSWVPKQKRGYAQGLTHAFSRLGTAVTPPIIALLMVAFNWRFSFVIVGVVSFAWVLVWFWYFRDDPKEHPSITAEELHSLPPPAVVKTEKPKVPWGALIGRMWPVTLTYFCYGWGLWLYLNWIPLFFKNNYHMNIKHSALFASSVFFAGVVGDTLGGMLSDGLLRATGNVRLARIGVIVVGFLGALASLLPIFFTHNTDAVALCLAGAFFFGELIIGPIWSVPMDIAPKYSGTAAGLMNSGSALAAIVSPLTAGYVIDLTGNWYLPFLMTIAVLLLGAALAFVMHPERPLEKLQPVAAATEPAAAE